MTRQECEQVILEKMKDIVDVYHQYNPTGNYLALNFLEGDISFNNEYWEDGADRNAVINSDNFKMDDEHDMAIEALKQPKPGWISVNDKLPEPFVSVLVNMPEESPLPTVHEGYISCDGIWMGGMFRRDPGEVTHWMPLPAPPTSE